MEACLRKAVFAGVDLCESGRSTCEAALCEGTFDLVTHRFTKKDQQEQLSRFFRYICLVGSQYLARCKA